MKTRICIFLITVIFMLSLAVTSNAEKLFWVDCGPEEFNCTNAKVYYVDPSSATPTKKILFREGVFIIAHGHDFKELPSIIRDEHTFLSGTLDLNTYQVTNLKTSYILYFNKNGWIKLVDTTTLVDRRLSNESGITPETLCEIESFTDWMSTNNSTIYYRLKGPDGQCDTSDDVARAVKVGMTPSTPPINIPSKKIRELLFDGRYLVENYSSYPWKLEICSSDLSSCKFIVNFTGDDVDPDTYDEQWISMIVDCKLMSYDYISEILYTPYNPPAGECVGSDGQLDKDDYIYFSTKTDGSPFTTTIYKVPVNGSTIPTKLGEIITSYEQEDDEIELSPTHVVYSWRESSYSAEHVYSFSKGGGTLPVVISDACVEGGIAGQYYFCEDTAGKVQRVKLDGTQRITRSNSQLNGATYGGSTDWYHGNPSTGRVFLSNISNELKSYAINEDFRNPTKGILIGTVPANLSNFCPSHSAVFGYDMLGVAMKRFTGLSFGTDILLLDATTPSSLKRLTNTNGWKIVLSD